MARRRLLLAGLLSLVLLGLSACTPGAGGSGTGSPAAASPESMLALMFPAQQFQARGERFVDQAGRSYLIELQAAGSFTAPGAAELLLVARRPDNEVSHVGGLYNAWAAVFNAAGDRILSDVLPLSADQGHFGLFQGRGRTYLFFAGPAIFQGWAEWHGGLWLADPLWRSVWPEDQGFWSGRAVEILGTGPGGGSSSAGRDGTATMELHGTGLLVLERRTLPNPDGRVIPPYEWTPAYRLHWNSDEARFERE